MARHPRLAALRRALWTRRAGWRLAAVLALLGVLLGLQRLGLQRLGERQVTISIAVPIEAARLMVKLGWLLLLLMSAGLVLGLALSSRRGRAAGRWLRPRLTTRPVRWAAVAVGVLVLLVLLVLVVVVLPPRVTAYRNFDKASEELKAQNDVRTTLLQALAGGVLALGAYFTYRQLRITREGHITDRFTHAIDQLGNEHDQLDVVLGGIYALERIARDSPADRPAIGEVLCAHIRIRSPWKPVDQAESSQDAHDERGWLQTRAPNIQAALTVLGRGDFRGGRPTALDLISTDLRNAYLDDAQFAYVFLRNSNLRRARLRGANLQGANLTRVDLRQADLVGANLEGGTFLWCQP